MVFGVSMNRRIGQIFQLRNFWETEVYFYLITGVVYNDECGFYVYEITDLLSLYKSQVSEDYLQIHHKNRIL